MIESVNVEVLEKKAYSYRVCDYCGNTHPHTDPDSVPQGWAKIHYQQGYKYIMSSDMCDVCCKKRKIITGGI